MVKRTLVVLSIISLMVVSAGISSAGNWWCAWPDKGACGVGSPMYVPVDCAPYPEAQTIIKTWSCKIEGPCPAPAPMCGASCKAPSCSTGPVGCCEVVGGILGPIADLLFGVCPGDFAGGLGGMGLGFLNAKGGACGPCYGPIPCVLAGVPMALGAPAVMFGSLW